MKVETKHYIESLEDYNDRSIIFCTENCHEEFIAQCKCEDLGRIYRFGDARLGVGYYFWYIDNMDVNYIQNLNDIDMAYPVTILELFADENGLYYTTEEDEV